ncbi:nicotinate-nucleotide adenylyltransferase [Monaibacterium marinum]|uniref:Probable nicotinate-nucleotide adenylyltransferase n=1 Tax=Pontivivens marinum TaxID=1690039 RepID=A0A2C9CNQ9_9RHOB|nr:nicotinate-nucleotide adenylyltransferase [Monaibacterium marinum]SOH92862.1 nicotinate-nucleotide adenylyltransferase [Monaibacterium marinum]
MRIGYPRAADGQIVGLLGGSFDPPHAGHVHITRQALKRFGLDRVWWLVSPGNPLKADAPASLPRRVAASQQIMDHPRVDVTDIETRLGTRYTAETIKALQVRYPRVQFVWLMGADNLASFHKWDDWQGIARAVPIGVLARPGEQVRAGKSPAARMFAGARLEEGAASALPHTPPPAWTMVTGPMVDLSSTAIRRAGLWER